MKLEKEDQTNTKGSRRKEILTNRNKIEKTVAILVKSRVASSKRSKLTSL